MWKSERQTNIEMSASQTHLMQSVPYSLGVNAMIMIAYHSVNSCFSGSKVGIKQLGKTGIFLFGPSRRYARTSQLQSVCKPSSVSKMTNKAFTGGNIHTKLCSNLLLSLTLH